ncbi:MAG TPA: two-component system response regulator [Sutterella sp.]|nr:two-component system response regulator [Sutterella sp.]
MSERKKILVVDDEVGIRRLFTEILGDEGYFVMEAENGAQADERMLNGDPDMVLLDIWLPDTDGISLLRKWAQSGPLPCPIVMVSGHASVDMAVEATKIGAFSFLEKPVSMKNLLGAVQNALKVSSRQKAIAKSFRKVAEKVAENTPEGEEMPRGLVDFSLPLRQAREQFERAYFAFLIEKYKGNISKVAEHAQVDRTNLYRKLDSLGVEKNASKETPSA